jgi:hypothetical protein
VSEPPAPVARRLRPPSWRDRRLVVGIVLVLGSVALGATVVGQADETEPVYAASHALLPGQSLAAGDVHVVRVQLGGEAARYLPARRGLDPGQVVIRSVQDGELVPTSALGAQDAVTTRPVAVPVPAGAIEGLRPGSLVDVWIATKGADARGFAEPEPVVKGAEVATVSTGGGVLASSSEATIRLLLTSDLVARVLSAVDNGDRVNVVPVPGSVPRGGS